MLLMTQEILTRVEILDKVASICTLWYLGNGVRMFTPLAMQPHSERF